MAWRIWAFIKMFKTKIQSLFEKIALSSASTCRTLVTRNGPTSWTLWFPASRAARWAPARKTRKSICSTPPRSWRKSLRKHSVNQETSRTMEFWRSVNLSYFLSPRPEVRSWDFDFCFFDFINKIGNFQNLNTPGLDYHFLL